MKWKALAACALTAVALAVAGCGGGQSSSGKAGAPQGPDLKGKKLVMYVSFHEDTAKQLADSFKKKTGADVSFIRLPTGEALARIQAEKDAPKADIWLGGTADAHAKAAADGYNEKRFKEEFEPKGVKAPETLEDLLKPEFKGEIIMPDPRKSGTGNTFISSVLQQMGPEKGWAYLKALKPQVAQFTPSGFTPGQKTGAGEYLVCLNFISDQTLVSAKGQKIHSTIYDQAGWTTCPVGKIKNHANDEAAKAFIDFVLTKEAGDILVKTTHGVACNPDVAPPEGMKPLKELPLFKEYDLIKAGADKQKNCDEFFAD